MAMTKEEYRIQGKKNRAAGAAFERKVRKDMIIKGWIVDKFTDNIDLDMNKIVQAKSNQWGSRSTGFPDFVMFRRKLNIPKFNDYELIFVECKVNGKLSKQEKLKMNWLLKNGHKCLVASKNGKEIEYRTFVEYKERN